MNIYTTSNRIAINNQSRFISKKISALLLTLICVLTLAACAGGGGGGGGGPNPPSPLNLRIIPDTNNATLIWNNPDAEIANISISYKNSTAANFEEPMTITGGPTIARNTTDVRRMISEGSLTRNTIYTFRVALEFGGADVNKSNITDEIRRLIGPNLDQDEYADADPLETDEDGDGTNDNLDAFPRNTTLSAFTVTELSARSGNGEVTLSWNNPAANISSIRISYHNTNTPNDLQRPPLIEDSPRTNSSATNVEQTITGLVNGQSYNFTVRLILDRDDAGKKEGVASTTATPGIFAVTDLVATPGAGSVILNWNNPDADIASISISYEVTDSGASTIVAASNTGRGASVEQTIGGLDNGVSYTFTVSLTLTGIDTGREGMAVSDIATPNVFSVTNLTAIPNDSSVTLNWINPDVDIASISISYEVTGSGASTTVAASNTGRRASVEQTITGLTNEEYYNFTVDLILARDYTGREGPALSIIVGIGPNDDGDGIADFLDVDADGDGLIEISTAAQLNQVRYNLLGSSLNTSDGVAGDASGCGGLNDISECNGYELTQNISLDGYNSDNWIPIGICRGVRTCNSESSFFDAIFDGNGWTISNLTITNPAALYNNATGLFGAISPDSILRNIHIRSANISGVMNNVGLLAGSAVGAKISNSSVEGEVTARGGQVGGLVGIGDRATITLSYAKFSSVRGDVNVGGLVGFGEDTTIITSSYATGGSVSGRGQVGGLVGRGDSAEIMSSYAEVGAVSGSSNYAGGMIGLGQGVTITSSYAKVGAVSGSRNLGGLVGGGQSATITSSYAEVGSINGSSTTSGGIGGLVGTTTTAKGSVTIISSYAATGTLSNASSENTLGGLLGFGTLNAASSNSYWNSDTSGVTRTIGSTTGNIEGRTTAQLQIPTDFTGIYATWATDMCDDSTAAWDLGLDDQYPALNCTPGGADAQRP